MGRRPSAAVALVWKRRIAEQHRSPLSIAEFCSREGVSSKSFYVWRKRLREETRSKSARSANAPRRSEAATARNVRSGSRLFMPVQLSPAAAPADALRIELPSGTVVTLPMDVPIELATRVIQAALSVRNEERPAC